MKINTLQARPLTRFWARIIDLILYTTILSIIVIYFDNTLSLDIVLRETADELLVIYIIIVFIFTESIFLSAWGTTPGKWLLNTQICDSKNKKLNFKTSLIRTILVWIWGLALTIIPFMIITTIIAYIKLTKNGITGWDKVLNIRVQHKQIETNRVVSFIFIYLLLVLLISNRDIFYLKTLF